jgi:transposase
VLSGRARTVPKAGDGITESIRALHTVRAGAVKSRTACINELHALLVTAPVRLREALAGRRGAKLVQACADLLPDGELADPDQGIRYALHCLAARVSPVPASSGKTNRHRLNRGGDRQANRALYIITVSRPAHDPRTRAYVQRRTGEGLSKKEIIRCLKRYIARELYNVVTQPKTHATQVKDLTRIGRGRPSKPWGCNWWSTSWTQRHPSWNCTTGHAVDARRPRRRTLTRMLLAAAWYAPAVRGRVR